MLLLTFDDLKKDLTSLMDTIQTFLGLDHYHYRPSKLNDNIKDINSQNVESRTIDVVTDDKEFINAQSMYDPTAVATEEDVRFMTSFFAPHNQRLESLLGKQLGWNPNQNL